jgi:uncharacterized cupredoxin-like copper-binding protein
MSRTTINRAVASLVIIALSATACSSGSTESTAPAGPEAQFSFGSPADATNADRTIEITTTDALIFEPAEFEVAAGEVVTFKLINEGNLVHDFTLGDQATQDEHEAEMAEMNGMAHDEPNVVTIPAGETAELTWEFDEAGTVLIGCHQPGHYAAGMTGEITVDA